MKLAQILCFRKHHSKSKHCTEGDILPAELSQLGRHCHQHSNDSTPMLASFSSHTGNTASASIEATTIVQGLQSNCLSRWSLTKSIQDYSTEAWEKILAAMEGNTSLRDWYIGAGFYNDLSADEFGAFLKTAAQKLKGLESLAIGALEYNSTAVDGTSIAAFVQSAPHLHTLRIERNVLVRSPEELQTLAQGFEKHASLKRVSLPSLHPTSPECSLDPLLRALAAISELESLQLGLSDESFGWHSEVCSADAVRLLGNLPCLTWLVLTRLQIADVHVQALCQAIGASNAPLRTLEIHKSRRVTGDAWKALLELLGTHVHLETVDMYCKANAKAIKEEVLVYLNLNRNGRRQALREATNVEEWIDTVQKYFVRDSAALHVLVRDSPWICIRPKTQDATVDCPPQR